MWDHVADVLTVSTAFAASFTLSYLLGLAAGRTLGHWISRRR